MMLCSPFLPPFPRLRVSGVIKRHGNKTLLSIIFHAEPSPNWNSPWLYQYAECIVQTDLKQERIHISFSFSSLLAHSLLEAGPPTHSRSSCITDTILACVCVCTWVCVCARAAICATVFQTVADSIMWRHKPIALGLKFYFEDNWSVCVCVSRRHLCLLIL